ncbi:secretion protein HlyD family protein [Rhizobium sp. PDO1-076]|nr:secretion protein HlyD family protein [Rhizobium sp. PDO1-076]
MSNTLRNPASLFVLLLGAVGVAVTLYAWHLPPFRTSVETTDNAYVRGYVTVISPQLSGYVAEVAVQDFQAVRQGDLIARIDDRIFAQKLAQAEATRDGQKATLANSFQEEKSADAAVGSANAEVASARAALEKAQSDWDRSQRLATTGVVTETVIEANRYNLALAQAGVTKAEAAVEVARQKVATILGTRASLQASVAGAESAVQLAEIDLRNTRIVAPQDGHVGEVGARLGQYVSAGSQLTTLVPDDVWVIANFKETQLDGLKPGQPVEFTVDALGGMALKGHIERFSPATGSEFSVIKTDNATGNFTKIAQRVATRISVDPGQELLSRLSPGMSVVVRVDKLSETDVPAPGNL